MPQRIIIPSLNYDQASAPANPSPGQVWRERDANTNDIIETWFWNGTYWISVAKVSLFSHRFMGASGINSLELSVTASTTAGSPGRLYFPLSVAINKYLFIESFHFSTDYVTGSWTVDLVAVNANVGFGSSIVGSSFTPTQANIDYTQQINTIIQKTHSTNSILMLRGTLNTSGTLRLTDFGLVTRKVR